jgi:type IV secretory pathway VirB6-like protein
MLHYLGTREFFESIILDIIPAILKTMLILSPFLFLAFILAMINPKLDFILALRNQLVRKKPKKVPSRTFTLICYTIIGSGYVAILMISGFLFIAIGFALSGQ